MVAIASAPPGAPVTTQTLSAKLHVSVSYLESILRILREAELIQSVRGPGGGYYLVRDADKVSIWDVVRGLDETLLASSDPARKHSLTATLDEGLHSALRDYLCTRTLDEFARCDTSLAAKSATSPSGFRLGPMPASLRPLAPTSVFDLSAFLHRACA